MRGSDFQKDVYLGVYLAINSESDCEIQLAQSGQHFFESDETLAVRLRSLNLPLAEAIEVMKKMPCYHFRIKSDKKKGGGRVSAAEHSRYIVREGKYRDYDEKDLERLKYENVITGDNPIETLPNRELILYTSPFGVIKQDELGIRVSKGASVETVAIALTVARYIYGNDGISVSGSRKFEGAAVTAAHEMELPIHFKEENLEAALQERKEKSEHERRDFERNGGTVRERHLRFRASGREQASGGSAGGRDAAGWIPERDGERRTLEDVTQAGLRLPSLSERHLVPSGRRTPLLLRPDEVRDVLDRRRERTALVRWDAGRERKLMVERAAQDIMVNVQKESDTVFASSHVQYINRESAFRQRGGCLYKDHHLPKWAHDDPKIFFDAADRFERSNGERYKEIEFALPSELPLEEQKKIVERFLEHHLKNHYYAFAIHDKIGAMSDGERHPHVHIMFSTREIDDAERKHERSPERFFSRANKAHPEKGGCKKAKKWNDKKLQAANLMRMREDYANIQNEVLQENGIALRVDHRSLKARREAALASGNTFLAQLLNRVPESSVGPVALLEKDNPEVRQQRALRKLNHLHEKNLILQGILQDEVDEDKASGQLRDLSGWLYDLKEAIPSIEDVENRARLEKQLEEITNRVTRTNTKNETMDWSKKVMEDAKLSAMTQEERELWQQLKENGRELQNWKDFLIRCNPSKAMTPQEEEEQQAILKETQKQIRDLEQKLKKDAEVLRPVFERLCQPSTKKAIFEQIAMKLSEGFPSKKNFQRELHDEETALRKLDAAVRRSLLRQNEQASYTAPEIVEVLHESIQEKEVRLRKMQGKLKALGHEVYSPARALVIAKNNFLNGEWKILSKEYEKVKKIEKKNPKLADEMRNRLDARRAELERRCSTPEAQEKIQNIAVGVLRKNAPNRTAYQKLDKEVSALKVEIEREKRQEAAVEINGAQDGTRYHAIPPQGTQGAGGQQGGGHGHGGGGGGMTYPTPDNNIRQIARALSPEDDTGMVNLVATSKPDAPDDWNLLSETEKEDRKNDLANLDRL